MMTWNPVCPQMSLTTKTGEKMQNSQKTVFLFSFSKTQCPKINFNKISNTIHNTYIGLTCMYASRIYKNVLHEILAKRVWKGCTR